MSKLEELSEAICTGSTKISTAVVCAGVSLAVALWSSPTQTLVITWDTLMYMALAVVGLNAAAFITSLAIDVARIVLYRKAMRKIGR